MPLFSDHVYDALVHVSKNLECYHGNAHAIDWDTEAIYNYCTERYGEKDKGCFSQEHQHKYGIDHYKKRRYTFVKKAKKYNVKDNVLYKNNKPVLRKGDYPVVLQRLHEEDGHKGTKKLREKVCLNYADVDFDTVDKFVGKCSYCQNKKTRHVPKDQKQVALKFNKPMKVHRSTFQRLGVDLTEYTDPRNDEEQHNLLIMIDYVSSFTWIKVLPAKADVDGDLRSWATGDMVGKCVLELLLSLGCVPEEIHSNYGTQFTYACVNVVNDTMEKEKLNQKFTRTAPYHPSVANKLNRTVTTVKGVLDEIFTDNDSVDVPFKAGNGREVANGVLAEDNSNDVSFLVAMACFVYNQRPNEALPKKLCPVDVWQPSHRVHPSEHIPSNMDVLQPGDVVEVITTDPPKFDGKQFDALKQVCEEMAATQSIAIAEESEVTTSNG